MYIINFRQSNRIELKKICRPGLRAGADLKSAYGLWQKELLSDMYHFTNSDTNNSPHHYWLSEQFNWAKFPRFPELKIDRRGNLWISSVSLDTINRLTTSLSDEADADVVKNLREPNHTLILPE